MVKHGVNANEQATSVSTPVVAESGIPFVVGTAPVQTAESAAKVGIPVLCTSWQEAVSALGYSDDWKKYTLCEVMYSHFKLYACQPIIFCNVLDIANAKESVAAADVTVADHKIKLSVDAINDATLVVKATSGGTDLVRDTDYSAYYNGENLVIELISDSSAYNAETLNVAYSKVVTTGVTETDIVSGVEGIELCLTKLGVVPDLICAPGFSSKPAVAAAMTAKAGNINGLFKAKPLIDIDCSKTGATTYSDVLALKNKNNITDPSEIGFWPMAKLGDKIFHMSTQVAGLIAQVDTENEGIPVESPSNKNLKCDGLVLEDGTEVNLTLTQANQLNEGGIVTALNFINGWVAWGNYTCCYPTNTDVKDYFIPVARMFAWVGNSLVKTFWAQLDKPMNRRLIDTILDSANIWINGLVGREYLLGGRVEMLEDENPITNLMAGIVKLHVYLTPPSPAQEIDFVLEYDANYAVSALQD